ncbi:MAG: neutral zinc metallopeptidase [Nocardioidaceae bacterium]
MSEEPERRPLPPADLLPPPQPPQHPGLRQPPAAQPQQAWPRSSPPPQQAWPGPSPYQQQCGHAGWSPPPRKRRSGLAHVLLGLVGAAAALFFALIIFGAAARSTGTDGQLAKDQTGSSTGAGADHAPADPSNPGATPVDSSDTTAVLHSNTLYEQGGLTNGECPAQPLGSASKATQTRFYKSLMQCLNDEWHPLVTDAGYSYQDPGLVVFNSPVTTPCGNAAPEDGRTLAFYCPGDSVMYADVPQMRRFFGNVDIAYAIVIGHEFGHHVQHETGILAAERQAAYSDDASRLALSRRTELQASCMGGLFLGAISDSFPVDAQRLRQLDQVAGSFGDEPGASPSEQDHGSGSSNHDWITTGFDDNDVAVCNTFNAPKSSVN